MAMNSKRKNSYNKTLGGKVWRRIPGLWSIVAPSLGVLLCAYATMAQSQQPTPVPAAENGRASAPGAATTAVEQVQEQPSPGDITGTIVDQTGAVVSGPHVTL